jgi:hypothetical protein
VKSQTDRHFKRCVPVSTAATSAVAMAAPRGGRWVVARDGMTAAVSEGGLASRKAGALVARTGVLLAARSVASSAAATAVCSAGRRGVSKAASSAVGLAEVGEGVGGVSGEVRSIRCIYINTSTHQHIDKSISYCASGSVNTAH